MDQAFGRHGAEAARRERERLAVLDSLDMLDTPRDEGFDRLVRLIKEIFTVEIGLVSFMDSHRQWYKACSGLPMDEMPREDTFCQHVVESEEPMIVPDATRDPRFASHPAVTGDLQVRFYAGVPLRTRDGHTVGTVCAIGRQPRAFNSRDLSILQQIAGIAMDRVEALQTAATDSLTGAMTRRAFMQEAGRVISLAARHPHDAGCIVFDVDHFKSVNDTHGHAAGDEVLKCVAASCREQIRDGDLFGRLGGEEFAIILPYVDREGALAVAEKLRSAIASCLVTTPGGPLRVTASFGITALSLGAKNLETLLAQADAAMYRAKQAGRDRCTPWEAEGGDEGGRRSVLKAGNIIFNGRRSSSRCTVRSLSAGGASLSVSTTSGIPEEFVLAMPGDGIETNCRVIAQDRQHIEVEFC